MTNENNQSSFGYNMIFKLIIIGDTSVGKTNILTKYLRNEFDPNSKSTVGVEFGTKNIEVDNNKIKLQIWDTAGQERYRAITSSYYKGAKGAILVYDITRKSTFENIDKWIPDLKKNGDDDIIMILVGNKSDLEDQRQVSEEEGKEKAQNYKIAFLETSAFNGNNIEKAFKDLIDLVYNNNRSKFIIDANVKILGDGTEIKNNNEEKKEEKKCC